MTATPIASQAARETAWHALASHPIRRAMLGRERCDAIAALAAEEVGYEAFSGANHGAFAAAHVTDSRRRIGGRVARRYNAAERCGFAFTTLLLTWAISAIVQALIARWWNQHGGPSR